MKNREKAAIQQQTGTEIFLRIARSVAARQISQRSHADQEPCVHVRGIRHAVVKPCRNEHMKIWIISKNHQQQQSRRPRQSPPVPCDIPELAAADRRGKPEKSRQDETDRASCKTDISAEKESQRKGPQDKQDA